MEVSVSKVKDIKVVSLLGELNSTNATEAHDTVLQHLVAGEPVVLDMRDVTYMSSAGIRTLLLLYRFITNNGGKIVLAGLTEPIADTMAVTGFLEHFMTATTVDAGVKAVA